jgi:hypothetical protein
MWQIPDAVDTVVCAPDDGWWYYPKHIEQFPDINKLCNVASCWIYIGIILSEYLDAVDVIKIRYNFILTLNIFPAIYVGVVMVYWRSILPLTV